VKNSGAKGRQHAQGGHYAIPEKKKKKILNKKGNRETGWPCIKGAKLWEEVKTKKGPAKKQG